tara:strand:- start:745 stop:1263 length:519 start_codon:yes stop_codon:yes gene_type:complete
MTTLEKMTVVNLKKLIKSYKQKSCPAMTGLRKAQLITLIKDLKITIPVITPISVQIKKMANTTTPTPKKVVTKPTPKKVVTKKVVTKTVTAPKGNTTTPTKSIKQVKDEFKKVKQVLINKISSNQKILKNKKLIKRYNRLLEIDIDNYKSADTVINIVKDALELDKSINKLL